MIGHECAGVIEEVGSEVKNLVPGDRVALEPGISCWRCDLCKEGRYNLCPDMKFLPLHQFMIQKASWIQFCRWVHARRRANIGPETNVLVIGTGPLGIVTMLVARAFGAPRIVIVDVDDNRLSVAKELKQLREGKMGFFNKETIL
ncbi:hypothetical protein REPUB_Repub08aG0115700 [Reevesia pubescens]